MSTFKVDVTARNPQDEELETPPMEVLVDAESEWTWLPAELLRSVGIGPRKKRTLNAAPRQTVEREVGYAILSAEGLETSDEVIFAKPGDRILLGARTLAGFGVRIDNIGRRFIARPTIVAHAKQS